jgi:PCFT/HCP family folate transporter-like MFS transporter 1/3
MTINYILYYILFADNVMTDFIVFRTCKSIPDLNSSECNILHENSSSNEAIRIEKLVQPHTALLLILKSCIETIFPTIMSLFLGPWSDKNGRKPLLIFPFTGI